MVRRGETIIAKGETLSAMALNKLRSSGLRLSLQRISVPGSFAANLLHATLIYSFCWCICYIIRKRLFYDNANWRAGAAFVASVFFRGLWYYSVASA